MRAKRIASMTEAEIHQEINDLLAEKKLNGVVTERQRLRWVKLTKAALDLAPIHLDFGCNPRSCGGAWVERCGRIPFCECVGL